MGCFTPGCNIFDLIRPLHPPSSVSKEPEQKGAPPIERFHHPGTERVTSAERNKDREPITHLPPIVARHPGTGHFLRRNKDLPRPCLVPQLTFWSTGLGILTIPEYALGNSQVEFFLTGMTISQLKEYCTVETLVQ